MSSTGLLYFRCFHTPRMKQLCRISILVLGIVALLASVAAAGEKEEKVLAALERIETGIEEGASYEEMVAFLDEAKAQVDRLKRGETDNCFLDAVGKCYYWYRLAMKSWESLMKNQKLRDKYAKQAEYGDDEYKITGSKAAQNYDTLVRDAQEGLPSKWEQGNAQLDKARECPAQEGRTSSVTRVLQSQKSEFTPYPQAPAPSPQLQTSFTPDAGLFGLEGTVMAGAKTWFGDWESSVLDWFEKDVALHLAQNGMLLDAESDPGSGYLAGPYLSYQTKDGKWSFSLAAMVFSSFSQDWEGSAAEMDMTSDIEIDRMDFDFVVIYSWNQYMKIFVGYKHQLVDSDFTLEYNTLMGRITEKYTLDSAVYTPAAGVGFVYPVFEKAVLGAQLGVLHSNPDLEITDSDNETSDISTDPALGFNGELVLNYQPIDDLVLQLGYRYQYFRLDATSPDLQEETESDDITHGLTFSAVWIF